MFAVLGLHYFLIFVAIIFGIETVNNFPYWQTLSGFGLPDFLSKLANFDGVQYLVIAKENYHQYQQAYFPLYPLLIRWLTFLTKNYLVSGLLIANVSFILAVYFLKKVLIKLEIKNWKKVLLLMVVYPGSFFLSCVYTEGLFLFLLVSGLYLYLEKKYFWFFVVSFLIPLTRLIGVFVLIVPFFEKKKNRKIWTILGPILGLGSYMWYLWETTGDPLFFLHSQPAFGANRSAGMIFPLQTLFRYIKIFLLSDLNLPYFLSIVEFGLFILFGVALALELKKIIKEKKVGIKTGLWMFSVANMIVPSMTGTLSSIPRYLLMSLSFFLVDFKKNIYLALIIFFGVLRVIGTILFMAGYFVG